jgi:hypothetical protein
MGRLVFKGLDELKKVDEKAVLTLWHDNKGIYIHAQGDNGPVIIYAKHCNPNQDNYSESNSQVLAKDWPIHGGLKLGLRRELIHDFTKMLVIDLLKSRVVISAVWMIKELR